MNGAQWWLMLDKAGFQMAWLLLSVLWQSSILLVAGVLLAYTLRRRRASVRHAVLAGAILCSPLIPLLGLAASRSGTPQAPIPVMPAYSAPVASAYSVPVAPTYSVPATPALPAGPVLTEAPTRAEIDRTPALPAVTAQPQEAPLAMLDCPWALALLAYAAGAGGLLCLVAIGKYRISRWAHRGRVVTDPRVLEIFRDARRRLGLARDFTVVENERLPSPMTVGTLHPVILLPAGLADDSSDDDLLAVALHELKHVQRCDSLLLTLMSLVRAVLFFHPLVWVACRQASGLAENACDDAVLAATGKPVPYARMLARLAEQLPRHAFATELAVGIVWSKSAFLRRVEAILSDRRAEIRKLSRAAIIMTAAGVVMSVAVAAALPLGEKDQRQAAAEALTTQPTSTQPVTPLAALPADDPRRGAAVTVELDKAQYYLGENVLLKWRIRNAGDQPFKISMGGDGRTPWARRAIRFKVECLDEQGRKMADPYPNPMNMGGPGTDPTLGSGQAFRDNLQLMRYREFPGTGKYTIKVYHDLGWEKGSAAPSHSATPPDGHLAPVATTTVRLVMPDQRRARQVVDAMLALSTDGNRTWGKWCKPFADFELLRYPVYLPIMKELAHKGDARGLDAIGAMAFPEATAALLELMNHKNPAIAAKAGDLLLRRMPQVHHAAQTRRDYLSERSWTAKLKKAALVPAWKLMDGNDRKGIIRGARLVQSLGGKDDLPALIKVMDRVLPAFKDDPTEQAAYLRPATASDAVVDAAGQLIRRGARPSMSAATPGQAVAFLIGLRLQGDFRPKGWRKRATGLIDHKIPFLRSVALQNMPLPLDDSAIAAVARAVKDRFAPVQGAACDLAAKAKSPAFRPPLLDVLQTTDNHWVLRSAFTAAAQCGTDNDIRLEVCVGRMGRYTHGMNMLLLSLLIDGSIEHEGGSGWQEIKDWTSILPGIQKAWMGFIAANRQALRTGKRFRIAQLPVKAGMFPPGFHFSRAGKSAWPPPPPPTPLTPAQLDHQESQSYDFIKRSVLLRLKRWRDSQPKTAAELEKYATEIVINLDQPEVLLKDGTDRVLRCGLSSSFVWTVYRVTPEGAQLLKAPVRLSLQGLASQVNICKEVFVLQGKLKGGRGVFADITTHGLRFSAGKGVANLAGYQFPEKQYAPTPDSINQSLLIARPVVTAPPAARQPAKNLIWGEAVDGIRCAVRPAKSSFAPDEDIVVDVVYSNASEGPITVCVCPDHLYTWVTLRVRDDEGKSMAGGAHGTGTRPPLKKSDFVTLRPGQTASFRQVIRYNPKAPVEPGRYLIQAEINKINRMDKHLRGLSEFIQKHGVPEPWCSAIQSPKTPIIIAPRPAGHPVVKTGGESVRVVGGYNSPRVDKARWGDMELVLELPKARYAPNEAIPVKLMIRNTGRKAIRLDGILPMRSSANPPSLDIEAPGHRIIRLLHGDGIVQAVRNEKTIVVAPNETIVLIDADLRRLSGTVQDDNGEPKYQKALGPFFGNGEYTIRGTFMPTPQIYASSTPKARFRIRAGTQLAAGAAEIDRLIKQLGSEKVTERKEAQAALIGIGRSAEARLLAATKDAKLERAHRAELALQEIQAATLQVRLESVEKLCIPGDVPRVRLEVRNIGDQPMRLMPLKYRGKLLNVSFRVRMLGEAGAARDCGSQAVPVGWAAPEPVEVRPGEALTVENQCMPSPAGTWGGKPWEVIAEYVTPRGKVISASAPVRFRYLAKLEFRIAPRPSAMGKAELGSCMDWLKAGRVGFWWKKGKGGRFANIAGRMPRHAWLPIAGELTNADQLVTGEYKGRKYVLVSDKSGQTMLPGKGKNAWCLAKAYATKGGSGRPAVGFELDARGAELFAALTKVNIRNALAIVVDDKVVSAPVLMSPLGRKGMITGRFSAQKVKDLVNALNAGMSQTPDGVSTPVTQPSTTRAPLDLDDAAKRLTKATGVTWRVSKRPRAPGLGAELLGVFSAWHGMAVPYCVLPFALDEQGKAKLELFRKRCSVPLYVIASDDRCIVLAGPSREPDVTAKVLAVLGMPESKEDELRRRVSASAEWLDFRLAVAGSSGAKGDRPLPLAKGPTVAQIKDYQELFAAKGPNGGRHRGDPFLWFWRLGFCELSPRLVTTETKRKTQYVLLSNRPEHVLLSGSARPRSWHFKRVYAATDPQGRPAVGLELDAVASERMGTLTGSNIGRPLAVLFHGDMLSVFTIEAKITSKLLLSGDKLDKALVDKIVRSLSECMLADNETVKPAASPATQPATQTGKWKRTQEFPVAIIALAERQDCKKSATPWRFEGVAPQAFSDGKGRYRVAWVKKDPLRDSYWYSWYEFDRVKLIASAASSIPSPLKVPDITQARGWDGPSAKVPAKEPAEPVTKAAIDEHIGALGSGVYKDRERAQQWLIDPGDDAVDALRAAAKGTGEASVRAKAALVEIGRRKLTQFFVGMSVPMPPGVPDSPEAPVRLAWIKALGELKDLRTTGILLDCLEDGGVVSESAGEALRDMSGQTFGDDPKQWRTWWTQVRNPTESTAALLKRLDDPRVEVRREAIWKLAHLRDPAALDVLVERFVNRSAGEPRGKSVMDEKMHRGDLPHLRTALVCMGSAAAAKMVRVSGYGWQICEPALAIVLQVGGQAVIDEAIRQVQSDDRYGRSGGAKVLMELRPLSGVLPLMRALNNSRFHDNVVDRALVAYDERALPQLRKAWEDGSFSKGTRLAAAVLLAHHGDDVGMSELADIAAKGRRSLMVATVSRMGKTRNPKFLPLIAKALARKDSQQAVAYAAAFCGGKDALPMLRQALSHPDKGVRYGARVWVEKLSETEDTSAAEEKRKLP